MSLRTLRRTAGMTQDDLAIATGLTQNTISRIETGANAPNPTTIRLLAAALTKGDTAALVTALQTKDGEASGVHDTQPTEQAAP